MGSLLQPFVLLMAVFSVGLAASTGRVKRQSYNNDSAYAYSSSGNFGGQGGYGGNFGGQGGGGNFGGQGGNFNCPQPNGQFPFDADCSKFLQCDNGVATLMNCQAGLVFNPPAGYCDFPSRTQNPNCPRQGDRGLDQANSMCQRNPNGGDPSFAFHVAHPQLCNAFYTCSPGYVFAPCTFCPEEMIFSQSSGTCLDARGQDLNSLCQGKQFVEHRAKVFKLIDGSCWPFDGTPNPYRALADKLRNGGGGGGNQGGNGGFNQGGGNGGFNNQG